MFHSDEVNEEAILFANWAYRLLHDAIIPYRSILAGSRLAWLLKLPDAIEILYDLLPLRMKLSPNVLRLALSIKILKVNKFGDLSPVSFTQNSCPICEP